jgi:glucose/mannose transport system permease protein
MNIVVVAPSLALIIVFVFGFLSWTTYVSLTDSKTLPNYALVGFGQYSRLWANSRWQQSVVNLAIFTTLFVLLSTAVGLVLAILLDQKIRLENVIRAIYLYPMAISFIVTGTAWKWILNPGLGLERLLHDWGFPHAHFDWIINPDRAIFTLIIAAVWQASGFAMATFLAGLRGIDDEILKAARVDGAGAWRTYRSIVIPMLRPTFLTVMIVLVSLSMRTFDLLVALTGGGPGFSSDLPTNFFYQFAFGRNQLGFAASSAMMIFVTVMAVMLPLIYSELASERRRHG